MTREDFVLAYIIKNTDTIYCRICMMVDITYCDEIMPGTRYCGCIGFREASSSWEKFNNQKAIPLVFSDGSCFLKRYDICHKSSCTEKITECDFRI